MDYSIPPHDYSGPSPKEHHSSLSLRPASHKGNQTYREKLPMLRFSESRQQVIETLHIKAKKQTSVVYMIHASRLKDSVLQT